MPDLIFLEALKLLMVQASDVISMEEEQVVLK